MDKLTFLITKYYQPHMVVSFVGAGGKTTALFEVANHLQKQKINVAITTTTKIVNPEKQTNQKFTRIINDFKFDDIMGISVVGNGFDNEDKVKSLSFAQIEDIKNIFDVTLVEADGSKRKPIKAPASHEPAIPPSSNIVVGVIGLNCLGKTIDDDNIHRCDLFCKIADCIEKQKIKPEHLISLIKSPNGLFKNTPKDAQKIVFLNQFEKITRQDLDYLTKTISKSLDFTFFL